MKNLTPMPLNRPGLKSKFFTLILSAIISINGLFAQNSALNGFIQDENKGEALAGANILVFTDNINKARATISSDKGGFEIKIIQAGCYNLKVSCMGYKDFATSIQINNELSNILKIKLEADIKSIDEVEVFRYVPLATLCGDTIVWNSYAYKNMPDANAEDMVEKLPLIIKQPEPIKLQKLSRIILIQRYLRIPFERIIAGIKEINLKMNLIQRIAHIN
jgi:hypothetical protein